MTFEDRFREKYRVALRAARAGDREATLAGLVEVYKLFSAQLSLENGDSILVKAKLSHWKNVFGEYIEIIKNNGLRDMRVRKLFGLTRDDFIPFGGLAHGNDGAPPKAGNGEIDFEGILQPDNSADPAEAEQPIIPVVPAEEEAPVVPAEAGEPIDPVVPAEAGEPIDPVVPAEAGEPVVPVEAEEPVVPARNGEKGGEDDKPKFSPDTLEGFIGQQHIVKVMLKEIAIAKAQGRKYLDNILLFGNPGLGKTTLMELIAKALGVKFELMDCSQYRNSQQSLKALQNFFMKIAQENEPVVIALDEIHMLNHELQSSLLTLLNNRVYVSPPAVNGVIKRIPIENFTFIAATTDDNKVLNTIKDRCLRLKFQMADYTTDELKRIYKNKVASKGLTITDEAIDICIPRSRGSIRYVNSFVDGLDTALYDDNGVRVSNDIDSAIAIKYFEEKGIDAIGLEKKDLEILHAIEEDKSGAIGVETLSARIGLDPKKYLSEYEPYLIKIGFVTVTGRGRGLTEHALEYLRAK